MAERRQLLVEEITELTLAIDTYGLMVTGSKGQAVLNPAVAARQRAIDALRKLEAAVPHDPGPDELEQFLAHE